MGQKINKEVFSKRFIGVFALLGLFAQPVSAALYFTTLNNPDLTAHNFFSNQGSSSAHSADYILGSSASGVYSYGTANAQSESINLTGKTTINHPYYGVPLGGSASGSIDFANVIFSNTTNPGLPGSINVSANLHRSMGLSVDQRDFSHSAPGFNGYQVSETGIFQVGLSPFPPSITPSGNLFDQAYDYAVSEKASTSWGSSFNTNFTTGTLSIDLNTPYTLSYNAGLIFDSGATAAGSMYASMNLLEMPFNLPTGFTVNSIDAGIFNNSFSTVPSPGAIWLFGSGLIGLIGFRKKATKSSEIGK